MRRLIISFLLLSVVAMAADFERSNWRMQLYLQAEPAVLVFEDSDPQFLVKKDIEEEIFTVPLSFGFLWSPLITPAWKADIPFTLWLGLEVNTFLMNFNAAGFGEVLADDYYTFEGMNGEKKEASSQSLSFRSYAPSVLGGFTFNIGGDFDLRVLGGYGFQFFTFTNDNNGSQRDVTTYSPTAFVSGALEYRITEVFQDVDLKVGINVRKEFLPYEDIKASKESKVTNDEFPPAYSGIKFDKISYKYPVRVGIEFSLDFGRESRRDRRMRFKLHDRDDVLRKNSEVKDTLSDWDCMAIERDYRFFLDEDGELPDMTGAYTRSQFNDVLESFLAFCHPADLATKEQLYSTLDSGKVQLKEYQVRQEDSRFDQVMASNDPEMLEMYLEYYPDSPRRGEVEAKLKNLSEYHKFREIQAQNTFKAYLTYLNDNPDGAFRDEAEAGIFELVKAGNRMKDYEIYLKRFPNGKYVAEAQAAIKAANNDAPSAIEYQAPEYTEPEQAEEGEPEEEVSPKKKGKSAKAKKSAKKAAKKKGKKK
ncbi:hypothetical protein [Fibrobacter sp. UBA4309]|uniref:hypothetical protein n=1 Tax=Fibrobacter sp. UBA4309 TaxID=1946537 RepID=UPI0025BA65A6|nr:hypothetical protein [Fibrobacter sp. UBA4309]